MKQATTTSLPRQQQILHAVREFGSRLFSFIRRRVRSDADAEDILQDVWYRFSSIAGGEPIQQTGAWLFRVARNRIIDRYRQNEPLALDSEDEDDAAIFPQAIFHSGEPDAESRQLAEHFWEALFAALEELPEEQREVFIWTEIEDLPYAELVERTGANINTLLSRKRYALQHLRKRLQLFYKEILEP